jgi:hypothetical protein
MVSRLVRLFSKPAVRNSALDGFVDSLLQTFENSRPGLTGEMLAEGEVEGFFRDLYEKELRPLREKIAHLGHLSADEQEELFQRVDDRIRKVVLPAYARLAAGFTPSERNDFYLTPEAVHGVERLAWAVVGVVLGVLVVEAPFIPLWSKEWVLVFGIGGFVFPTVRRYFALRRYQHQLNDLVTRTDDEIWRLDLGYLTAAWERGALPGTRQESVGDGEPEPQAVPGEDEGRAIPRPPRVKKGEH